MEPCTTTPQAFSHLQTHHHHPLSITSKPSFPLRHTSLSRNSLKLHPRLLLPRATTSEETPSVFNPYAGEERGGLVSVEDVSPPGKNLYSQTGTEKTPKHESTVDEVDGQTQIYDFFNNLHLKLDNDDTYTILVYGGGALFTLWLASAVVGAIDSIPLFPKFLEVVGLGYTIWFSTRYLVFKKNREELVDKIQVLKQRVFGSDDDTSN